MIRTRAAPSPVRFVWAMVFALVLAMRLLTPTGFMPAFEQGRLTIIECPGSGDAPMPPMRGMGHDPNKTCQTCPHATASGAGLTDPAPFAIAVLSFASTMPAAWQVFVARIASGKYERPPAIGPPISI